MPNQKQRYSSVFKAEVVLKTLQGMTVNEVAYTHKLAPATLRKWKKHFLENIHLVFDKPPLLDENMAKKLGALKAEKEALEGKLNLLSSSGFFSNDITDRNLLIKQLQEEVSKFKHLAVTDALTGIYNRYKTNYELDLQILRSSRYQEIFSVIMLDIDWFKKINDTFGHDIGDSVLQEFSSLVVSNIRKTDCFGRWGGEEFLLILPHQNKEQALNLANKIKVAISSHTFRVVNSITVSIGITEYQEGDIKEEILKKVDDALYNAKKAGRNLIVFK